MKWREKYSKIYTIQKTNNLMDLYIYILIMKTSILEGI